VREAKRLRDDSSCRFHPARRGTEIRRLPVLRATDPEAFIGSYLASDILDARLRPLADALRSGHALIGEVAAAAQALNRDEFWAHVDILVPPAPGWRGYRPAQGAAAASHRGARPHGLTPIEGTTT
jgi:hypothetical protein